MWSLLQKSQRSPSPFEIIEKLVHETDKPFELFTGKMKSNEEMVTVFRFKKPLTPDDQTILSNSVKRLKTLRHPGILLFKALHEGSSSYFSSSDGTVTVATESVLPLQTHLKNVEPLFSPDQFIEYCIFGIYQVTKAINFLHSEAKLRHNNINMEVIFANAAYEWKIGDLTHASEMGKIYPPKVARLMAYDPPEVEIIRSGRRIEEVDWAFDSWGLGTLIWEIFSFEPLSSSSSLQNVKRIPSKVAPLYLELMKKTPKARISPQQILEKYFIDGGPLCNSLITNVRFLEEIHIKDKSAKSEFFTSLNKAIDGKSIPMPFLRNRMLPLITNAQEYGEAGVSVLDPLLKIGKVVSDEEFKEKILPGLVKLFMSTDRATRSKLLLNVPDYIGRTPPKVINDTLFELLIRGFYDTNTTIRDMTVRAFEHIAPKLNSHNLNHELLGHFSRIQSSDPHEGVRASTTVCLAKIASHLDSSSRQKILLSAFLRALKDPSSGARLAGILGLITTQEYYSMREIAQRVLPQISLYTIDKDYEVRQHAFKAIRGLVEKLENFSEDPEIKDEIEKHLNEEPSGKGTQLGAWTQWAVSALTSLKFSKATEEDSSAGDKRRSSIEKRPETNDNSNKISPKGDELKPTPVQSEKPRNALQLNKAADNQLICFDVEEQPQKSDHSTLDGWDDFDEWISSEKEKPRPTQATSPTSPEDPFQNDLFVKPVSQKPKEPRSRPMKLGAKKVPKL